MKPMRSPSLASTTRSPNPATAPASAVARALAAAAALAFAGCASSRGATDFKPTNDALRSAMAAYQRNEAHRAVALRESARILDSRDLRILAVQLGLGAEFAPPARSKETSDASWAAARTNLAVKGVTSSRKAQGMEGASEDDLGFTVICVFSAADSARVRRQPELVKPGEPYMVRGVLKDVRPVAESVVLTDCSWTPAPVARGPSKRASESIDPNETWRP